MAIVVRPVVGADEAAWRQLFDGYIAFYRERVPAETITLTWQRILAGSDGLFGLIAEDESGRAVGIANLVFHRSTWSPTWYCYLEDLFVDPSVRGQGAGRALIEATYAEADRRGATRTYWATQDANAAARGLYDRLGHLTEFVQYRR